MKARDPEAACGRRWPTSGRDRGEIAIPTAADLVAGRVEARDHPGLLVAGAGEDRNRDGDDGDTETEPRDEHAGQDVAEICRPRRHGRAGCRQRRPGKRRRGGADAVLLTMWPAAWAPTPAERCEDEGESGGEQAPAEDVLEVKRAEQEEAEDRPGCGEHQEEAAADSPIGEPLDAEERRVGAALESPEDGEADEVHRGRAGESGRTSNQRRA